MRFYKNRAVISGNATWTPTYANYITYGSASPYTATGIPIGTATATREVVVGACAVGLSSISGITVRRYVANVAAASLGGTS